MNGRPAITIIIPSAPYRNDADVLKNLEKIALKNTEVLIIKGTWPPLQRNIGIQKAQGKYIFFFDDDIIIPKGTIQKALHIFESDPEITVIGGPNITPIKDTFLQKSFGEAHASVFTGYHTAVRYKQADIKITHPEYLITCNLAFRTEVLKNNHFGTQIYANEENELLNRIAKKGYKLTYNKDFFVYHHRRPTVAAYTKQILAWGAGRTMHFRLKPQHFQPAFFVPLLFLGYLITIPFYNPWWYMVPAWLYLILNFGYTLQICREKNDYKYFFTMPWIFFLTHISYAMGLIKGLFQPLNKKTMPSTDTFEIKRTLIN